MSSNNDVLHPGAAARQPDSFDSAAATAVTRPTWARDFAFVGGASAFLAPFLVADTALGWPTLLATAAAGAVSGAALGGLLQGPMRGSANRGSSGALAAVPWPLLGLLFVAVGAFWGALVGAVGATVLAADMNGFAGGSRDGVTEVYLFFMGFAAAAAAMQLAWFGVAYARMERARVPTWPLLVAACGTPFLGWVGLRVIALGLWSAGDLLR